MERLKCKYYEHQDYCDEELCRMDTKSIEKEGYLIDFASINDSIVGIILQKDGSIIFERLYYITIIEYEINDWDFK